MWLLWWLNAAYRRKHFPLTNTTSSVRQRVSIDWYYVKNKKKKIAATVLAVFMNWNVFEKKVWLTSCVPSLMQNLLRLPELNNTVCRRPYIRIWTFELNLCANALSLSSMRTMRTAHVFNFEYCCQFWVSFWNVIISYIDKFAKTIYALSLRWLIYFQFIGCLLDQ